MNFKHFVLIGAAGLFGLVLLLVLSNVSKNGGAAKAVRVDADELLQAYQKDEDKADKQFKNKTLEVSGTVTENTHGFMLELDSGVFANAPDKAPEDPEKSFNAIRKGQRVIVRGICRGLIDQRFVNLEDCELVKVQAFHHP